MRLQVFLSHNGVGSRRRAMELIQQGHVAVNGQVIREPSWKVNLQQDTITVDGKSVESKQYEYVILNKPQGYVTTMAEHRGEKSVLELLPEEYHYLKPAGRLDKDTEGLLLFTNDGDVAYKLTHPKFNVDKVYYVEISGQMSDVSKRKFEKGVSIEGEMTSPAKIKDMKFDDGKTSFNMTIHEGKKRQIRLMCKAVGHEVDYLKRISQGPLSLGNLKTGQWRQLAAEEIKQLKSSIDHSPRTTVSRGPRPVD
jgi:pseudouridine synthase